MTKLMYANIILPLPIREVFTYSIPPELTKECNVGKRVVVPFGKKKLYTGIIQKIHAEAPINFKTKPIISVLDTQISVNKYQLRLWEWTADYYMCPIGDVYKAALPSGLRIESETRILPIKNDFNTDILETNELFAYNVLLQQETLTISELGKITNTANPLLLLKKLLLKKAVVIQENVKTRFKAKTQKHLSFSSLIKNITDFNNALAKVSKAKKQQEFLNWMLTHLGEQPFSGKQILRADAIEKSGITASVIKSLIDKEFLLETTNKISRLEAKEIVIAEKKILSTAQSESLDEIKTCFKSMDTVLLHGVTSSGKTEIFIHLIEDILKNNKQILYLLPEIALTSQIVHRLKAVFGNKVGVYHSKFSDSERVEIYNCLANDNNDGYRIILGVRSSIFLPFSNLGLIIVDEEHENTYKQFDPSPRYNARDLSVVLGKLHNAKILLGTATPSLETYYNTKTGRYGLVELMQRHKNIKMPEILVADVKRARNRKTMQSHFTPELINHIDSALANGEQAILFQNRRGFSPFLECNSCGWVPTCKSCDVSLTYHKGINKLVCHYCGYSISGIQKCQQCNHTEMATKGFGTEKVEDEIQIIFPEAKVGRLDLDTARGKHGHEIIISDFQNKRLDILIGTQMVSKGLDFDHVSIVGILNADSMLRFPDFRANERSFQLMAQVSGRAGRKNKQGTVIIQTTDDENLIIKQVIKNRYDLMFNMELKDRQKYFYPPFSRIVKLILKHRDKQVLNKGCYHLASQIKTLENIKVLGPTDPPIHRIQNLYIKTILVKLTKNQNLSNVKKDIFSFITALNKIPDYRSIQIIPDVDPM